ncbi:DUF1667 domain-containing protein [Alkalibacter saccharofermentans]|uniref:CxxC motif-containing protein n=1 Tax=Alkalibacter saccharofermentans DSM 14828 TaxID=1120975 RepID=A0A1M4VIE5_9FIRM|nr:DUF1667 domain-containing protein [Alkalibacter saccharofermentans]SHE68632.1 CxxC motif-containing protein [Alkalibacter saccharofermentans DSM 14828]
MGEIKKYTCVVCPKGCSLLVEKTKDEIIVTGQKCPRGVVYGKTEMTDPRRVITSTVAVAGGKEPITSVKTTAGVPKAQIFDVMSTINSVHLKSPCKRGDVIIKNINGTGADLVVTRSC